MVWFDLTSTFYARFWEQMEKIQIKHRLCPQGTHILLEDTDTHSLTRTQPEDKRHSIARWFCWTTKEGLIYSDWRNIGKLNQKRKHLNGVLKDELDFDKWRRWCIQGRGTSLSEDLELYTVLRYTHGTVWAMVSLSFYYSATAFYYISQPFPLWSLVLASQIMSLRFNSRETEI